MTRQEIIDSLQTCRNAKCYDCRYHEADHYPECLENLIEGITPHIIREFKRIEKLVECLEYETSKVIVGSRNGKVYQAGVMDAMSMVLNLLKGDDTHANPSQP